MQSSRFQFHFQQSGFEIRQTRKGAGYEKVNITGGSPDACLLRCGYHSTGADDPRSP